MKMERAPGRGTKRDSMFLLAVVRTLDGQRRENARIRNISAGGLMAECVWSDVAGTPVVTELKGLGPIIGKVAWNDGARIGINFDLPIDPKLARKPSGAAGSASVLPPYLQTEIYPPQRRFIKPKF